MCNLNIEDKYEVKFPSWAMSYLFNGDASSFSLSEDDGVVEQRMIDEWIEANPGIYAPVHDSQGFCHCPEFGPACDCETVTVIPFKT